jgi:hypothetical protein
LILLDIAVAFDENREISANPGFAQLGEPRDSIQESEQPKPLCSSKIARRAAHDEHKSLWRTFSVTLNQNCP